MSPSPADGFEERLERLRRIVDELEKGDLPLERALERYEEGVRALKGCAETLSRARARVEELSREAEDALKSAPESGDAAETDGDDEDVGS